MIPVIKGNMPVSCFAIIGHAHIKDGIFWLGIKKVIDNMNNCMFTLLS
jgi:hypothetical protein